MSNPNDNAVVWYQPWTWPIWGRPGVDIYEDTRDSVNSGFLITVIGIILVLTILTRRR